MMAPPVVVLRSEPEVIEEMPNEEVVALPCTSKLPVVVAPPQMVRPVMLVPAPIVDEASEVSPPLNWVSDVVAFPAAVNG
jgi:hypothetical protein